MPARCAKATRRAVDAEVGLKMPNTSVVIRLVGGYQVVVGSLDVVLVILASWNRA